MELQEKMFTIEGFMGSWFPMWMGGGVSSSCLLINLVSLSLISCKKCEQLLALGQLPSLRYLFIDRIQSVRRMGEELYGGGEFPSLIHLRLYNMESLEEWVAPPPPPSKIDNCGTSCFPLLAEMFIIGCEKLTTTPTSFSSLKRLYLWNTSGKSLCSVASGLNSLTFLNISKDSELIHFPSGLLRCLRELIITGCEHFQGFGDLDYGGGDISSDEDEVAKLVSSTHELLNNCCSLEELILRDCPVLTILPNLQSWTSLRKLMISDCNGLKNSLPTDRNCLSFIEDLDVDILP